MQNLVKENISTYDTINLKFAASDSKTAEEILESIADDLAGVVFVEGIKDGKLSGAALVAG